VRGKGQQRGIGSMGWEKKPAQAAEGIMAGAGFAACFKKSAEAGAGKR